MANWSTLKAAIANVIKTNGNQEITGQILQNVLVNTVTILGKYATFAGTATPATNPGAPDGPVFYLANQAGTYANFDGITLSEGEQVLLVYSAEATTWSKEVLLDMSVLISQIDELRTEIASLPAWHKVDSEEQLESMIANNELLEGEIYYVEEA